MSTLPFWAKVGPARLQHIQRVAALVEKWSTDIGVPNSERTRWLRAVWLHDALRDAAVEELEQLAPSAMGSRELLHGPASASRAKAEGETDRGVLDAVRYHSLGLAEWDMVGRVLYCADFLEPGRPEYGPERSALAARFPADPQGVLHEVAKHRLLHLIQSGWSIPQTTWRFWNELARSSAR